MINYIRFEFIAGEINKIPEFYTIFARKMPDYIMRQQDRGQVEAKCLRPRSRPRPKWPRGHFGLKDWFLGILSPEPTAPSHSLYATASHAV